MKKQTNARAEEGAAERERNLPLPGEKSGEETGEGRPAQEQPANAPSDNPFAEGASDALSEKALFGKPSANGTPDGEQPAKELSASAKEDAPCESAAPSAESSASAEPQRKGFFAFKVFNYRLVTLLIMCIIMSFIGFVVENVFRLARDGVINSRRQFLPFLFAYGIAVFVMYVFLGTPKEMRFFLWKIFKKESKLSAAAKYTLYALILFCCIFFGEVLFGTFVEWVSGVVLWDYTGIPLRFTKYTSVPTALGLTAGIMLFMRFVFEPLMNKLDKLPDKVALGIDIGLGVPIVIDWIVMLVLMLGFGISKNWWLVQIF